MHIPGMNFFRIILLSLNLIFFGSMLGITVAQDIPSRSTQSDIFKTQLDVSYIQSALLENKVVHEKVLEKLEKVTNELSVIRGMGMGFGAIMGIIQILQMFNPFVFKKMRTS